MVARRRRNMENDSDSVMVSEELWDEWVREENAIAREDWADGEIYQTAMVEGMEKRVTK